jgi:NhaP-type Na+/H+ or K+/H+ antiporter
LHSNHYWAELDKLKHLTAEATFFVRTFFFLLLGYSTDLNTLVDVRTWAVALSLVAAIFLLRLPVLWLLGGGRTRPLVWAAPRGLITVLLFYSLPAGMVPDVFPPGALILVVLLSCVVMAIGFRKDGGREAPSDDDIDRRIDASAAPPY